MSIREILMDIYNQGRYWEDMPDEWNLDKEISRSILAIKDELMRVMPEEDLRGKNIDNIPDYQLGKLSGWNYYRSQMISAITKICEEEK